MSEPKLISPMLDNFDMGEPISDHNGVRCCPAMEKNSDNKYIVKIVSTPASQIQLDALLLSGAFQDSASANNYFKTLAEGIIEEAAVLKKLSKLEGFLPHSAWQLEPMEGDTGYDVYLLSEYKNTLQQVFRHSAMSHLGALNMGLDICSALAVCRRSGYLYVNLKPSNIYLASEQGYRIGDIGFMRLDSLKYASLPDRYRSEYTAPEIADAFSALNTTIDIYALGLILYQAYNDGILPVRNEENPAADFPAPAYADYEMAEIILKACAADPNNRWQDPTEMGQALVAYMQRNGANDTPITPIPVVETESENFELPENCNSSAANEISTNDESVVKDLDVKSLNNDLDMNPDDVTEEDIYTEDEDGNLTFLDTDLDDETIPNDVNDSVDYNEVSDEVSDMLIQADKLIEHETPDPVVQPEPIDIPLPPPIAMDEEEPESDSDAEGVNTNKAYSETEGNTDNENSSDIEPDTEINADVPEAAKTEAQETTTKHSSANWLRNIIIALVSLGFIALGVLFYMNYYLQTIDSILLEEGENGSLTVLISSSVPDKKLTVICSDTYGNQLSAPVKDGKAEFTDLAPNAAFRVSVQINGFHRLIGDTTAAYTTPQQTNVIQFTAVTGSENGSAVLGFTVEGRDLDQWKITYNDDSGTVQEVIFTGHMLTVNNLTIGKEYEFNLTPVDDVPVTGVNTVKHTARSVVTAKTVIITGCTNNLLTAAWAPPEDTKVNSWTVRCYGANGFDQTIVTEDTNISFEVPDTTSDYTVEVIAEGMSVSERAYAAANSITIDSFTADNADPSKLIISWNAHDYTPQGGWILLYTADGSAPQEIICKNSNQAEIAPLIPGCEYIFTLQAADGRSILGGNRSYNSPAAPEFDDYAVSSDLMEFTMCETPSYSGWSHYDLSEDDYTTTFAVGEEASFVIHLTQQYDTSDDTINTLFVIRDANGAVVDTMATSTTWREMWYNNYCELDIPSLPQTSGDYTITVYFNGAFAGTSDFSIVDG